MSDWLALHGVGAAEMRALLKEAPARLARRYKGPRGDPDTPHGLSLEAARDLCATALHAQLGPGLAPAIARMRTHTRLVPGALPPGGPRALTLPDGGDGHPLITCPFDNRAHDLITLAHEMGHALQAVASDEKSMPPVLREACAFAAEEALLAHLADTGSALLAPLQTAWRRETARIMARPLQALHAALDDLATPYDYLWNYPPARVVRVTGARHKALFGARLGLSAVSDFPSNRL